MPDNKPTKHHCFPVFYLKRWANSDGKLCEFSRPFGKIVKPRRVRLSGTGWVNQLYAIKGMRPVLAHQVEEFFFKPIDSAAAESLERGHQFPPSHRHQPIPSPIRRRHLHPAMQAQELATGQKTSRCL